LKKLFFSYWYKKMKPVIKSLSQTEEKQRTGAFCCRYKSDDSSPYQIQVIQVKDEDSWSGETYSCGSSIHSLGSIDRVFYKSSDHLNQKNVSSRTGTDHLGAPGTKRNSSVIWRASSNLRSNWDIYFVASDTEHTSGWHERDALQMEYTDWEESEILTLSQPPTPNNRLSKRSNDEGLFPDAGNEVLLSFLSKLGLRYTTCPLNTRLEEVAAWLNLSTNRTLPICEISYETIRSGNAPTKTFRRKTLSEVFGERLDPSKTGITFFLGPVEGKTFFKMILCDIDQLKRAIRETDCIVLKEGHNLAEVTNDQREETSHLTLPGKKLSSKD